MFVKVCGLKHDQNVQELSRIEAIDLMGFIYVPESPRYVGSSFNIPDSNKKTVGVFKNAHLNAILSTHERMQFDYIQLHGSESPEMCQSLRKHTQVIKAFSIRDKHVFEGVAPYEDVCDLFLFDTPSRLGGGSGKRFDWSILRHYKGSKQFLLSGGIGPQDAKAIQVVNHPLLKGIDINSGFETRPGQKDRTVIQTFLKELSHEINS